MSKIEYPNYRWVILGALCAVQAATVAVLVAPATLIGDISGDIGLSLGLTTGVVMALHNVPLIVSAIFGGALIDRFGPYRVWAAGMLLLSISLCLMPVFGSSLSGMIAIRTLHGLAAGPIMATAPLVVAQWSPLGQRGIILGIQGTFVSVGAAISMLLVPALFERTGSWQVAMAGVALLPAGALLLSLTVVFGRLSAARSSSYTTQAGAAAIRELSFSKRDFLTPTTWAAALCGFWFSWSVRMVYDIIPSYLAMETPAGIGMGALKSGRVMAIVHILSMAGGMASGILMEKCFKGRPRGLVMAGFLFSTLLWLPLGFPGIFTTTVVISLCVWIGSTAISMTYPLVLTFISKYCPERMMGKISGLITGASTFGTLVGLVAGSYALHLTGRYHVTILFICGGAFLGFISSIFLREPTA
jgi:MFS family permease